MRLRTEIITLIGVMGILVVLIIQVTTTAIFDSSYNEFDKKDIEKSMVRIATSIEREVEELNTTVLDYGAWNDTRDFVEGLKPEYPAVNMVDDTFAVQRLDMILIFNLSGGSVFQKGFDYDSGKGFIISNDTLSMIADFSSLPSTNVSHSGIIEAMNQSTMIAACDIVDSLGQGPVHGRMVFCRLMDAGEIDWLSRSQDGTFTIASRPSFESDQNLSEWQVAALDTDGFLSLNLNETTIVGFQEMKGGFVSPAIIIRHEQARTFFFEGKQNANILSLVFGLLMLAYSGVALVVVDRVFFRRFWDLSNGVHRISESKDFSARIKVRKVCEEINIMTKEVNNMLDTLEKTSEERMQTLKALDESRRRHEEVINNQGEGVGIVDKDERFVYANPAAEEIFGADGAGLAGRSLSEFIVDDEAMEITKAQT